MGQARPVSIVIVSHARPRALYRCLTGVGQLDHSSVEVVVVTCPAGRDAIRPHLLAPHLKVVPFDQPNISAARNLGIAEAAGDVVAFLDDDAVPEPLWLHHLTAPFASANVACAGGYVIGRNGISLQWAARSVDTFGNAAPIALSGNEAHILHPTSSRAIKTEGTNMAVRREVLAEMGGFDPAFRFYLDETDLNLRLARAGAPTALVPLAQVHHGFAASARRTKDRVPRDLTQIGASMAVFLRKHAPTDRIEAARVSFFKAQRTRLLRLMQSGPLGADDVWRLMGTLSAGWNEGLAREILSLAPIPRATKGFQPIQTRTDAPRIYLSGRPWQARRLANTARQEAERGAIVTLTRLSPSALYHKVRFHPDGYWLQTGGVLGRSDRDGPIVQMTRFESRILAEQARVAPVRGD